MSTRQTLVIATISFLLGMSVLAYEIVHDPAPGYDSKASMILDTLQSGIMVTGFFFVSIYALCHLFIQISKRLRPRRVSIV